MRSLSSLKGKLLLIHGTADDNVHMRHSMEMAKQLIQAGKQFDMFMYPNQSHGINQGINRFHVYEKISQYILLYL